MLRYRGSVHWEGVFIWGVISSSGYCLGIRIQGHSARPHGDFLPQAYSTVLHDSSITIDPYSTLMSQSLREVIRHTVSAR